MNFLNKIEDLLNRALLWLGALLLKAWMKVCPAWLLRLQTRVLEKVEYLKTSPARLKARALELKDSRKELLKVDYRGVFTQAIEAGKKVYNEQKSNSPLKAMLSALATPFEFLFKWAQSLSPAQFTLLFAFTTASVMSGVGIALNSHRIMEKASQDGRSPASVPVEVDPYDRPEYYKRETREVSYTNVKVPVFVTGLTDLKSLLIDFSVNATNRKTKQWLERHEFEVRDHLVMTVEPVLPTFPLTDEGRTVVMEKLKREINIFLEMNKVDGKVHQVHLIYVLAN